eukprot:483802-Hanusia_phi.AAC.3
MARRSCRPPARLAARSFCPARGLAEARAGVGERLGEERVPSLQGQNALVIYDKHKSEVWSSGSSGAVPCGGSATSADAMQDRENSMKVSGEGKGMGDMFTRGGLKLHQDGALVLRDQFGNEVWRAGGTQFPPLIPSSHSTHSLAPSPLLSLLPLCLALSLLPLYLALSPLPLCLSFI